MTREEKQKAIDALKISAPVIAVTQEEFNDYIQNLNKIMDWLEQEPKTGHWIEKEDFNGDTYYDCSECGESFCLIEGTPADNLYNYCPNCGSRNGSIVKEGEEND